MVIPGIEDEGTTINNLKRINFCHWADFWGGGFGPVIIVGEHKTVLFYPIVVSVDDKPAEPNQFNLSQNYPNPFNPVTKIKYTIPALPTGQAGSPNPSKGGTSVQLIVYDILGREVKVLVNEEKQSGAYEIEFDGDNLPSGVYLYRLTAGEFTETKKLVLLK